MAQSDLVKRAQQGDVSAIAHLLNQALQHKQMTAEVNLEAGWLKIRLEAPTLPDARTAMILVDRAITKLHSPLIQQIRVEGRQNGAIEVLWYEEFEPGARANPTNLRPAMASTRPVHAGSGNRRSPKRHSQFRPQAIDRDGRRALITGLILAIILLNVGLFKMLFAGFIVLVHEVGHAITHWLFGRPAIPTVNLLYGGGITLTFEQSAILVGLIYLGIGYLFYRSRSYPRIQGILAGFTALYSLCLATNLNHILSTFMGHGMEWVAIALCLYLSTSGYFCRFAGDRSIYAMLGFFTLFYDLQFSWQLAHNLAFREWYEGGIGGVMDNDFVILANEYLHVDLAAIANLFLFGCVMAPILAFGLFRYENWWRHGVQQLFVLKEG